ncbi:FIG01121071: hypothetical protein [hydrothermal vent metagenome]|uniref:HEAT repeat domain-containing protein n=1 Tax=hydrothermal vent metagenome TaxID=652676 RepID=A0A3B0V1C3_9ZZZZ
MTAWNQIVKTALLGTSRADLPSFSSGISDAASIGDAALGKLLNQIPRQEEAAALLSIAGAMALHSQTGWQPPHGSIPPAAATNPAELPLCPNSISSQPERGHQIVEQTWKSNNGLVRHQLIKILATNLSMADEPFLEIALDDRNHLVRRTASDLLARLPQSRLSQHMTQFAANVLF